MLSPWQVRVVAERDRDDVLRLWEATEATMSVPGLLAAGLVGTLRDGDPGEDDDPQDTIPYRALVGVLQDSVGRLIWNGWPTGVAGQPSSQLGNKIIN